MNEAVLPDGIVNAYFFAGGGLNKSTGIKRDEMAGVLCAILVSSYSTFAELFFCKTQFSIRYFYEDDF